MNRYRVIGVMSGTSLDGLDLAYCEFYFPKNNKQSAHLKYKIIRARTIKYNLKWKNRLSKAFYQDKTSISSLSVQYGKYIAKRVTEFIRESGYKTQFISSHGHTILHQPTEGVTIQIGDGNTIATLCKLPVICDFRSGDVALGGQGAPLVPIVDKLLFADYSFCLNLGGFANISFDNARKKRIAFDICPANIVLNYLAGKVGKEYDAGGNIASRGKLNFGLLKRLNTLNFYKIDSPKSLGREWVETEFLPVINAFRIPISDKLRTVIEHIVLQIARIVNQNISNPNQQLLITGGGVYNKFLIVRLCEMVKCNVLLPDDKTIQFKEAMAFAFLGVLKMREEINILKSVTGAKKDSVGGRIFLPYTKKFIDD